MSKIYVAEENKEVSEPECRYLALSGMEVEPFYELGALRDGFGKVRPDLIIMNPIFSDGDGYSFLKSIREKYLTPVIITSETNSESDRVLAFELGCDDYLVKPFSMKELVLRINAILRRVELRNEALSSYVYEADFADKHESLIVNISSHRIQVNGVKIELTAAEWRVLSFLCSNAGSIVSRVKIMEKCFEYSPESYERIVDTHIKNIRAKIGESGMEWIETIRGYGYRFTGVPVTS